MRLTPPASPKDTLSFPLGAKEHRPQNTTVFVGVGSSKLSQNCGLVWHLRFRDANVEVTEAPRHLW